MPDFETPPTLTEGDTGDDVVLLQQFLIALGFSSEPADGNFTATTAAEVVNFKSSHSHSLPTLGRCRISLYRSR